MKMLSQILLALFAAFALVSCGGSAPEQVATINSGSAASSADNLENEILFHVNRYRTSKGLQKLQSHPGLDRLAFAHSQAMQKRDHMGHFDFAKRAKTAQKKYQMGGMSENLHRSWGYIPSGQNITNQWANSPKHEKNMTGRYNYAGMGIARDGDRIFTTLLLGQGTGANSPAGPPAPFLHF
jgi:uncharacterized protein YkwD